MQATWFANADVIEVTTLREVRLFDLLVVPAWKLIYFNQTAGDAADLQQRMFLLQTRFGVRPLIITTAAGQQPDHQFLHYDLDEVAHKIYGIKRPTLFLIRPDQYVAVRADKDEWVTVERFLGN